jgi:hypothetical protein
MMYRNVGSQLNDTVVSFFLLHLIHESEKEFGYEVLKDAENEMKIMPLFSWFGPSELFLQLS